MPRLRREIDVIVIYIQYTLVLYKNSVYKNIRLIFCWKNNGLLFEINIILRIQFKLRPLRLLKKACRNHLKYLTIKPFTALPIAFRFFGGVNFTRGPSREVAGLLDSIRISIIWSRLVIVEDGAKDVGDCSDGEVCVGENPSVAVSEITNFLY